MKKYVEEHLEGYLELMGIAAVVTFGWQLLEQVIVGNINPNGVDTIVGFILIASLNENLKSWKGRK